MPFLAKNLKNYLIFYYLQGNNLYKSMKVYLFYTKQRRSVLDIDFESLIKNSKANIPNKKNLLNLLTIKSPKGNAKEKSINLTAQQNFQRYGDLVINIALFNFFHFGI